MLQQAQISYGTLRAEVQSSSLNVSLHLRVEHRLLNNTAEKSLTL